MLNKLKKNPASDIPDVIGSCLKAYPFNLKESNRGKTASWEEIISS